MLLITERHLRNVLDSIPAPVALVDLAGRHWFVNEAYRQQIGAPDDQIIGRTIEDILGSERYAAMRPGDPQQPLMERARKGETVRYEGWLGYPEGPRYVQRIYFPYRNDRGVIEGVFAFSRDVSDLKRSQEQLIGQLQQLRVAHTHLQSVLEAIPGRVALFGRDERHRYANQEYCDFVGVLPQDVIGKSRAQVIGRAAAARLRPDVRRALRGETVRVAGWVTYRQGQRFVERVILPHRTESGDIDGYFNFTRDLTELRRSEEDGVLRRLELLSSEAHNAAITASALDCIIAVDDDGAIVEWNPAAVETFGWQRAEVLGRRIGAVIVPAHHRERHELGMTRYKATGEARMLGRQVEVEALRRDGTVFPAEIAMNEVQLPNRRLFTAHLRDLTAARAASEEIRRQRDTLHQVEKMAAFGSLLSGVAHELNNPLSIVIGNALMLAEEAASLAPALAERAGRIQAAAERCGRISNSFLKMARAQKTEMRQVSVDELVDSALQLLAYPMRSSGVAIERDIPAGLPSVQCDPDQIHQVLTNLLVNARQELEDQPQPRRLRLRATSSADAIEIEVADNGQGVPPAIVARVFDPFFTTKPIGSGTGIGLTVSRGIAEVHGGTLTLRSSDLGGACFVLRLPCAPGAAPGAAPGIGQALPKAATGPVSARKALIVDDELELGQVLAELLRPHGVQCDVVSSGEAAKEQLTRGAFDMVLCDLRMPGTDGPALFSWMEAHVPHYCARTAFVTGDTLGHAAGAFLARSGRPVLEKPFSTASLARLLSELAPTR